MSKPISRIAIGRIVSKRFLRIPWITLARWRTGNTGGNPCACLATMSPNSEILSYMETGHHRPPQPQPPVFRSPDDRQRSATYQTANVLA
jgi:hypothetical protein